MKLVSFTDVKDAMESSRMCLAWCRLRDAVLSRRPQPLSPPFDSASEVGVEMGDVVGSWDALKSLNLGFMVIPVTKYKSLSAEVTVHMVTG